MHILVMRIFLGHPVFLDQGLSKNYRAEYKLLLQ